MIRQYSSLTQTEVYNSIIGRPGSKTYRRTALPSIHGFYLYDLGSYCSFHYLPEVRRKPGECCHSPFPKTQEWYTSLLPCTLGLNLASWSHQQQQSPDTTLHLRIKNRLKQLTLIKCTSCAQDFQQLHRLTFSNY